MVDKAHTLAPVFREQAPANEAAGRLFDEAVRALRSGDFFAMKVPTCFGGLEADPAEVLEVYETMGLDP